MNGRLVGCAVVIEPLRRDHIKAVARLHHANLTGLLSELGIPATEAFYFGCVRSGLAVGAVYMEDGAVRGFVLGSPHPDRLKRDVLKKNPAGTLAGLGAGIVRRPSSLLWLLKSFRGPDEGSYDGQAAELTYLAVATDNQGSGIGRQLIESFTGRMRDAGTASYELSVDEGNDAAIAFYERLGFRLIGLYREFGVRHRRYRLEINPRGTSAD